MKVSFHPDFPEDVRRFRTTYQEISGPLGTRFQSEIGAAIEAIKQSPTGAGHFLNFGTNIVHDIRRRNLRAFPFFIVYGLTKDTLIFGSIIPSRSDPLTWLIQF